MKILHCIFSFNVGGAETMLIDVVNNQASVDEVGLCIINKSYSTNLLTKISNKVKVILLNRKEGSRNINDIIRLNKTIITFGPNIIHCHDSKIINYLPTRFLYPTYLTVHGTKLSLGGIKKYDHIIAISQAVATDLEKRNINQYHIIHNGIKTKKLSLKKNIFLKDKHTCKILQIGRLEHTIKGQHLLIKSLYFLKKENLLSSINITVDFIGTGSSLEFLQTMAVQLEVNNLIHFIGLKDREYIYSHIKDYDFLVQPSINEGFGLTIAEAMVVGVPVLVSDVEGPLEVIGNGKYGYTFQCGNALSLAKQITYMIKHSEEVQNKAIQGQKYATENYDISTMVAKYSQLYSSK